MGFTMTAARYRVIAPASSPATTAGVPPDCAPGRRRTGPVIVYCAVVSTGQDRRERRVQWRLVAAIALVVFAGALVAPPGRAALDPFGYLLLALPVAAIP